MLIDRHYTWTNTKSAQVSVMESCAKEDWLLLGLGLIGEATSYRNVNDT